MLVSIQRQIERETESENIGTEVEKHCDLQSGTTLAITMIWKVFYVFSKFSDVLLLSFYACRIYSNR